MKPGKIIILAVISVIGAACIFNFYIVRNPKKKHAMEITFASKSVLNDWRMDTASNCVSFLLTKDKRIFYYSGKFSDGEKQNIPQLKETSFQNENGISNLLETIDSFTIFRQRKLEQEKIKSGMADSTYREKRIVVNADWRSKVFLIKADSGAMYNEFVKLVDELKALKISKFVNVDISESEILALKKIIGETK